MADAKFVVNGQELEIPDIDSFTMGEAIVFERYTGLTLDQLDDLEGARSGVIAAKLHIAIARANPGAKEKDIREMVEATSLLSLLESMSGGDADPPAETPPNEPSSSGNSDAQPKPSGPDSEPTGDAPPADDQSPTGTPV